MIDSETAALGRPQEAWLRHIAHVHLNLVNHVIEVALLDLHVRNRFRVVLNHHLEVSVPHWRPNSRSTFSIGYGSREARLLLQVVLQFHHLLAQDVDLPLKSADPVVFNWS